MRNSLPDTKRYRHELSGMIAPPIFRYTLFPAEMDEQYIPVPKTEESEEEICAKTGLHEKEE
jgi:hypothetical protein